jgi:ferredoxin
MSNEPLASEVSGFEPELGGEWRETSERTGFEPELGGKWRQKGVFVDEYVCIGCRHCAHVASNTFYIEPENGRSRVFRQDGNTEEVIQEAIDTCPVDCIHWLDYTELKSREDDRKHENIQPLGFPSTRRISRGRMKKIMARKKHL